jgi:hypothetical protein
MVEQDITKNMKELGARIQETKAKGMKGVLDCEIKRRILVGDFAF